MVTPVYYIFWVNFTQNITKIVSNITKNVFKTYLISQFIKKKPCIKNLPTAVTVLKKERGGLVSYDHDHRFNVLFCYTFPNTIIAVRRPAANTAAHKPLDPRAAKIYAFKL